jgi:1-deoxy-D-xylulose-5-phosphate reductoisomerase
VGPLEFVPPDFVRFPCLSLAYRALACGASYPVVLNAANEIAVDAFLEGRISFTAIAKLIEQAMDAHVAADVSTIDAVRAVDQWARIYSQNVARGLELKV